jgi:glycosyltransferase involved in cell wall biosynthesis
MHSQYQGAGWRMVACRWTDKLTDATTAVSDVARRDAIRHGAVSSDRIVTVPNGIDLRQYAPDAGVRARVRRDLGLDGFVWLAVGRLTAAKDYPNLIRAFGLLHHSGARSRLLIAGTALEDESVRSMIDTAGLGSAITLMGPRSDVPDLMRAADGYVMSSAWEGLPLVVLEAGASSLPIVATDAGGNSEAVLDGTTGFIVKPKEPQALAAGMRHLLELDAIKRREMGEAGRRHVADHFDIDAIARGWHEMYVRLLRHRRPR